MDNSFDHEAHDTSTTRHGLSRRRLLAQGGLMAGGAAALPALASCSKGSSASGGGGGKKGSKVTVWWNSGFYPEEDEAVKAIAADFQKESGMTVDLQFYSTNDIPTKEQSAVTSGVLPDVVEAENGNTATYAYQGHLADVTDVVNSQDFSDGAKKAVNLYNSKAGKTGYFAVPIDQFTVSLFYWKDMLEQAGADPSKLPTDWNGFWKFFEDAQGAYKQKTNKDVYALGWPMSTSAGDTHYDTQMVMMAFDAMVLSPEGKLQVDDPKVKAGIANGLEWLAGIYKGGFTPKDVVNWKDADNNTAFLNRSTLATPNGSLSIPGAVQGKNDKEFKAIVTTGLPNKPSGGPVPSISQVHNAVVFDKSPNKQGGIDFLKFFVKPENTLKFLKAGKARWFPVQNSLLKDDYFAKSSDPNIKAVDEQLSSQTEPAWLNVSVGYNHAELQGMWGNAIGQVVLQGKSPQDGANYAIQQLKQSFNNFPTK